MANPLVICLEKHLYSFKLLKERLEEGKEKECIAEEDSLQEELVSTSHNLQHKVTKIDCFYLITMLQRRELGITY